MACEDIGMIAQNGKTAVVSVGSADIATALSQRLAAEGFAVVLAYADEQADAEACVKTIRAVGGRAAAIEADLRRPGAMRALLDAAEAIFAGTDVLVSDADFAQLSRLADSSVDDNVTIDLKGTLSGLREGVRRLRIGGRIIGISGASPAQRSMRDADVAMEECVGALTRLLAAEMHARCLTLNAVALCCAPVGLAGDAPENLGDAIAFLAGPDGAAVNGRALSARP
jgi:3-oxoacyl-[acyl-carrier protein] reductase